MDQESHQARFAGVGRVIGPEALGSLAASHACVIGIGGVGSWVAEALARSGVGTITLVDLDDICVHNINRQIHAVTSTVGRLKVDVMAARIRDINPGCIVHAEAAFFTPGNADALLDRPYHIVVDAIDRAGGKAKILAECRRRGLPAVTTGGAGGKRDPLAVRVADLATTSHDPLLFQTRKRLRRWHGFPRDEKLPFDIPAVFSMESPAPPACPQDGPMGRLDCAGSYGSLCTVTAVFGFLAAHAALRVLTGARIKDSPGSLPVPPHPPAP